MNKEEIKEAAISMLEKLDAEKVESIGIVEQEYDDGTPYLEITVDYHSKGGER